MLIKFPDRQPQTRRLKTVDQIRAYIRNDTRGRRPTRIATETEEEYRRRCAADYINKAMWHDHRDEFEQQKKAPQSLRGEMFRAALEAQLKSGNGVRVWRDLIAGKEASEKPDVLDLI